MNATRMDFADLPGMDLGTHTVVYDDVTTILYALTVGADETDLGLVYERDLRALPTMACGFGLWAVEAAGRLGAYDPLRSLHAAQRLTVTGELPVSGEVSMSGRIAAVWDKGKASVVEIEVTSEAFTAGYTIFLPGQGGWGGERGPSGRQPQADYTSTASVATTRNQAALYRLTGDRHPVHIDPAVAAANGFDRPILHGLCTLGLAVREAAVLRGLDPSDLRSLSARMATPVLPGDTVEVGVADDEPSPEGVAVRFGARVEDRPAIADGCAVFARR